MIAREQIEKTTAEWESQNPILAADVIGIEITTSNYLRYKRGDGATAWKSLSYLDRIPPAPVAESEEIKNVMSFATAATTSTAAGGKDIDLRAFTEYDSDSVFTNARYSSSYGYGIRCAKAGKYLVSATLNLQNNTESSSTVTAAIRRVVGGTSAYIARTSHTFEASTSGHSASLAFAPQVVALETNAYLSLYVSLDTAKTKAEGCWLTAVYLGQ